MINLSTPVHILVRNLDTLPLNVFGRAVRKGVQETIAVTFDAPLDDSWNRLIRAIRGGRALVSFPRVGGLAEALVEAALRQVSGVEVVQQSVEDSVVSNTASETAFAPVLSVDGSFWRAGLSVRVRAAGYVGVNAGTEPSVCIRLKYGSTLILSSGLILLTDDPTTSPWSFDAVVTCVVPGVNGSLMINGQAQVVAGGLSRALSNDDVEPLDLSRRSQLMLTAEWDAAHASNKIVLQGRTDERLPPPSSF